MTTKLISIGNSKGIRIPKSMIQQYQLDETDILLKAKVDGILIKPVKKSRTGWMEQFSKAVKKNKDIRKDEIGHISNDFDKTEWTW